MKKVLFVTTISNTFNAFLIPHINLLVEKGFSVDIACSVSNDFKPELLQLVDNVHVLPFSRSPLSISNVKAGWKLKKLIDNNDYDFIHTHTPIASMITRIVSSKIGDKVLYTAHGFHFFHGSPKINWLIYYPIEKVLSRKTENLITINSEDYNLALKKFHAKKVSYVHGVGVDLRSEIVGSHQYNYQIFESNKDKKILVSVGELNNNKNHIFIIEALRRYYDRTGDKKWKYFICGEGVLKKQIEEYISSQGLCDNVILLGFRTDIRTILKYADCFIFPSFREGLPVSIMEAMRSGTLVMASNIRGNRDLISNGKSGFLFNPKNGNEIDSLLSHLFTGVSNEDELIEEASRNLMDYSLANVMDEMSKVYFGDTEDE